MILQYIKATGLILDISNRPVAKVLDDTGLSPAERDHYGRLFASAPYLSEFCNVVERGLVGVATATGGTTDE